MIGLAFCARPIVQLVLTDKWLPCVPYLQIFCVSYLFWPIHTANLNAIKAMGRSDLFLKLEIIKKFIGMILLVITMNISVMAMAYSLLISGLISQVINSWPNRYLLKYSYIDQIKDIFPNILMSLIMGGFVYFISYLHSSVLVSLMIQILLGGIIYLILSILTKNDSFIYLINILKSRKG